MFMNKSKVTVRIYTSTIFTKFLSKETTNPYSVLTSCRTPCDTSGKTGGVPAGAYVEPGSVVSHKGLRWTTPATPLISSSCTLILSTTHSSESEG